ncbi:hypothetical protein GCM10022261_14040 [Brevibacterium daeguense]|uniref:D-inositol 3-phosphate glycosyltransferase n=1 Tax=Brevibacterium daeguense TaxID=909936 RepID=A0ABP8EIS6_9MICO|nr:glycosyltransferase [Brevibacterium daeguense]
MAHQPMTICIPAETYAPEVNGAAKFTERLAVGLAARGHDVHVISPSPTGVPSTATEEDVTVHRIRSHRWYPHPTWTISTPWETKPVMGRLLDEIVPDVVHTQAHFVIGRYAFSESRKRGIPVVATNHFMPDNVRPYVPFLPDRLIRLGTAAAWWDLRRTFQLADRITVPTQLASDLLAENGFAEPIRAVSCGIDLSRFRTADASEQAAESRNPDRPTVLFVGRLSKEKHVDDIVRALAASDPSLNLHAEIVGAGDQEESLRELAVELGVAERVALLGKVSDAELVRAYQRATFFCLPGTAELQSIATLEALASGLPVVLADAVALPHLCRHGGNGFLFEPRNVTALANAFDVLCTMPEARRAELGRASQEIAASHDVDRTLDTFEDIYAEVICHARAA